MRKQLLYLTNTELTAYQWQRGRLSDGTTFQNDESGWLGLSAYLSTSRQVPIFMLMDLIEEDFHQDTMPHVLGNARKALTERRLLQLYRDTPFRHASHQGREKTGRRDDVMLFCALTNAPLIKPWIDTILNLQVPVAGIFSTALLSALLVKQFHPGKEPVLLITHQTAGLRQNFFHNGYLRFSRLTKLPTYDSTRYAEHNIATGTIAGDNGSVDGGADLGAAAAALAEIIRTEIGKTRLFLANTRQLQRGDSLKTIVLDSPAVLQSLHNLQLETDTFSLQTITPDQAGNAFRLRKHSDTTLMGALVSDHLFLTLLAVKNPTPHYQLREQSHAYTLWKSRIILYVVSAAILTGCVLWSLANAINAVAAGNRLTLLERESASNAQKIQDVLAHTPKAVLNPHDMKASVTLYASLAQHRSSPKNLMLLISQVLTRLPQLSLTELSWEVSDQRDFSNAAQDASAASTAAPVTNTAAQTATVSTTLIGVPNQPSEMVVLKGQVLPFKNNYRSALQSVELFCQELTKNKNIQVSVLRQPLDIRPSVGLTGEAGVAESGEGPVPTAQFELKILWVP